MRIKLALALVAMGLLAGSWAGWSQDPEDGVFREPGLGPYGSLRPFLRGEARAQFFSDVGPGSSALLEAQYSLVPTLLIPCRDVEEVQEQMVAGRPLVCHVRKPEILETWIAFLKERARASGLSLVIKRTEPGMVVLRMRRP